MKDYLKKCWSLLASLLILLTTTAVILIISTNQNQGHLVYTLDDAYIHMALSKNLAQHGVWGVTKYEFTSCSSSLLWTASLAFVYIFTGPNELVSFILNMFYAVLLIWFIYFIFKREGIREVDSFITLVCFIFASSLIPLIFTGLEHVFHTLVSILFVYFSAEVLSNKETEFRNSLILIVLAVILPVLRYEGLVLIGIMFLLLLLRKKWFLALSVLIGGTLPIIVFGLISVSHGWSFFPNSLTMKAEFPDIVSLKGFLDFTFALTSKLLSPANLILLLVMLIVLSVFLYYYLRRKENVSEIYSKNVIMVFLVAVNIVLYYIYSRTGWTYRYQAFLIALIVFVAFLILAKKYTFSSPLFKTGGRIIYSRITILFVFFAVIIYYFAAGVSSLAVIVSSTTNVYEQQYQTAVFVKKFYNGKEIALTDIGTTNFFADIKLIDFWGLGDIEVSRLRRTGEFFNKEAMRKIAEQRKIKLAFIFESSFVEETGSTIPEEWSKVGQWKISNNIVCADDVVSIYAVDPSEESVLIANLKKHSSSLPPQVIQSGKYLTN